MIIGQTGGVDGPQPIQPGQSRKPVSKVQSGVPTPRADKAEISLHAQLLQKLREMPELRQEKVDAIRDQIADGSYESDEKIRAAVNRLFEDIA